MDPTTQATIQAALTADRQQLYWVILIIGLPGIISLLLKLVDMRKARQDHDVKAEEKAQSDEAEEKRRQDQTVLSLVNVVSTQVGTISNLAGKIDAMTQEMHRSNDLNEQRNLLRDKRDSEQAGAMKEHTSAIAQNTLNLADVESVIDETKESVKEIPAHIEKAREAGVSAVAEKIDSATEKILRDHSDKLVTITQGLDTLQVSVVSLQKKLDEVSAMLPPDLKDFREKFDDLKAAAEKTFQKLTEIDQASHAAQAQAAAVLETKETP